MNNYPNELINMKKNLSRKLFKYSQDIFINNNIFL